MILENVIIFIVTSKNATRNSVLYLTCKLILVHINIFFFINYWHKKCWYYIIISLFLFYSSFLFLSNYPKLIKNCRRSKAVKNGFVIQLIIGGILFINKLYISRRKLFLFPDHSFVMIPFWFSVLLNSEYENCLFLVKFGRDRWKYFSSDFL